MNVKLMMFFLVVAAGSIRASGGKPEHLPEDQWPVYQECLRRIEKYEKSGDDSEFFSVMETLADCINKKKWREFVTLQNRAIEAKVRKQSIRDAEAKRQKFEQDIRRDLDSRKRTLKLMEDNEYSWGLEQQKQSFLKAIDEALSNKYPFQDEWQQLREQYNRIEEQHQVREAAKQKKEQMEKDIEALKGSCRSNLRDKKIDELKRAIDVFFAKYPEEAESDAWKIEVCKKVRLGLFLSVEDEYIVRCLFEGESGKRRMDAEKEERETEAAKNKSAQSTFKMKNMEEKGQKSSLSAPVVVVGVLVAIAGLIGLGLYLRSGKAPAKKPIPTK